MIERLFKLQSPVKRDKLEVSANEKPTYRVRFDIIGTALLQCIVDEKFMCAGPGSVFALHISLVKCLPQNSCRYADYVLLSTNDPKEYDIRRLKLFKTWCDGSVLYGDTPKIAPGTCVDEWSYAATNLYNTRSGLGNLKRSIIDAVYRIGDIPTFDTHEYERWMLSQNTPLDYFCASLMCETTYDMLVMKKRYMHSSDIIAIPSSVDRILASREISIVRTSFDYLYIQKKEEGTKCQVICKIAVMNEAKACPEIVPLYTRCSVLNMGVGEAVKE